MNEILGFRRAACSAYAGALAGLVAVAAAAGGCSGDPAAPVWTATSKSLTGSCFGFFQGSMRFEATRDQLSPAQLDLASKLQTVDAVAGCPTDVTTCTVTVMQADGSSSTWDSLALDSACAQPRKVISFASFDPFVRSLGCRFAKDFTFGSAPARDPLTPDARCFNGLFTGGDTTAIAIQLGIDDAGPTRHIELDGCDQPSRQGDFTFTVLDSDGATVLGTSAPVADAGPNGTCARLDQVFPHTGSFGLNVAVAPTMPAGDFYLRFY